MVISDGGDNELPAMKVESEAREGEDDDAVTEASDSNNEAKTTTRSGRMVRMPKKYDGFEMTAAEIWLMQQVWTSGLNYHYLEKLVRDSIIRLNST